MSTQNPPVTSTRPNSTSTYEPRRSVRQTFTESKAGVKTTEFWVMIVFVAGVLLSTYADQDTLARRDGWFFAALAVGAYILSRGLAKLGSREPYTEDRDR